MGKWEILLTHAENFASLAWKHNRKWVEAKSGGSNAFEKSLSSLNKCRKNTNKTAVERSLKGKHPDIYLEARRGKPHL